ncbi:hypothetical protein BGW36DRAFT_378308 [Talaromyces proteolyticus]|uniref:BZIP domain-containing protein n=1 Tax=Talaromyces proteolyticus TaxID=1131652 RepID=A0AAD4Q0J3_9EURO|nr:uncharacterized protein BGW36DRAFT_378308 [Talaromyces proteolyticus]KAH8697248.1 hypothetical protein BGW36DRAFT_378308 [Talaromyces proteolyticus]
MTSDIPIGQRQVPNMSSLTSQSDFHNAAASCDLVSPFTAWELPTDNTAFSFDQLMLLETNPADFNLTLGASLHPIIETNNPHSPTTVPMKVSGSQIRFNNPSTVSRETNIYRSPSPTAIYQLSPAQQPQHYVDSSNHAGLPSTSHNLYPTQRSLRNVPADESTWSDTPSSQDSSEERLLEKRRRNKLAAQRLRQKRQAQMSILESRLEQVTKERDELRLRLAKWEGEVMALRKLTEHKMGSL